jgi:hypothetical protein
VTGTTRQGEDCPAAGPGRGRGPALAADSFVFVSPKYDIDDDGRLVHRGDRPAEDEDGVHWQGHGYTDSSPWVLRDGRYVRVQLRKHRWTRADRTGTVTSQPPDLVPRRRVDALVVASLLLEAMTASVGLHSREVPTARSRRQLQRDLAAACELAEPTQHAVRLALMHRSSPRPVESLWEGGLDPPPELARRCRHPGAPVAWRALEMVRRGAEQLGIPATALVVEARRRWTGPEDRFLI